MIIAVLQISDAHFRENGENPALGKAEAIVGAVAADVAEAFRIAVAWTGDVAYSGKKEEYRLAGEFLTALRDACTARDVETVCVAAVPGNHDCDFDTPAPLRGRLLESRSPIDQTLVPSLLSNQEHFRAFCAQHSILNTGERAWAECPIELDGCRLRFVLVNSAITSTKNEQMGTLRFPQEEVALQQRKDAAASREVRLGLLHHPYRWFQEADGKTLFRSLENHLDVILTGHEHDGNVYRKVRESGIETGFVEGGVLQQSTAEDESSFNVVYLDTEKLLRRVSRFQWHMEGYVPGERGDWTSIWESVSRRASTRRFSNDHFERLEDIGAAIQHPRKERVSLSDLFVYPDLREMPTPGKKGGAIIKDAFDFVANRKRVVLSGKERSGKTSLARRLCVDLLESGMYPVLIQGESFVVKSPERTRTQIRDLVRAQYGEESLEEVMRALPSARALVVDDFDGLRANRESRARLIQQFEVLFGRVVLFCGSDYCLEHLLSASLDSRHALAEYSYANILQLGNVRRHQLVSRWYWLGRQETDTEDVVNREAREAGAIVTSIIGRNLLPSFPIFVLVLLQQIEGGRRHSVEGGSFGHMYGALLTASLSRVSSGPHVISTWMSYLTELAWDIYSGHKDGRIHVDALRQWHNAYCERLLVDLDFDRGLDDLQRVLIMRLESGYARFAYSYILYYFVASYLRSHIGEEIIRERVRSMIGSLHVEKTATVMLFLAHLSNDSFVLDEMERCADSQFREYPEWKADLGNDFLNSVALTVPKLAELRQSAEKNFLGELERRDSMDDPGLDVAGPETDEELYDESEDEIDPVVDALLGLNAALKTIQIIGQILRSYPGAIPGAKKVALARSCFGLGMRLIGFALRDVDKHGSKVVDSLVTCILRARPEVDAQQLATEAGSFLFALYETFCIAVLKHLSYSLGQEELAPVYRRLMLDSEAHRGFEIVDLAIKLDHFRNPPVDVAIDLYESERKRVLSATVVRHLVWHYLYLFPVPVQIRQRLCAKLSITDGANLIAGSQKLLPKRT